MYGCFYFNQPQMPKVSCHLFYYEARKNKPQVNYGKQKTTRINYVVLAHENNLDNIHLVDDSNEFVHRKDSHKQTF